MSYTFRQMRLVRQALRLYATHLEVAHPRETIDIEWLWEEATRFGEMEIESMEAEGYNIGPTFPVDEWECVDGRMVRR